MKKLIITSLFIFTATGCATKQYPQAAKLSLEESSTFDCKAIEQEIAKTHSIQQQIDSTGDFDGKTVLGFMGDFGIGNGMAKSDAKKKAAERLNQLETLKASKCGA